ncbi:MFS transporter [Streptomyces gamaensis]|uniref:MFS transporter n=1 Tax=Streptomyces gamaensis TaxID=1763542 RepID=A0ABW0YXR9_9ACTN
MSYVSLLRQRPVLVLWSAETLSVFGDRFFTLALAWTAWQRSGAVAMGLVVVLESVPHLLVGAFGRQLVARVASFRSLAVVEALQIVVIAALPWLWPSAGLAGVLAVILVIGTCDALTGPSLSALVPGLVAGEQVRQVTGLMDASARLTWFLGPGSAAVLLSYLAAEDLFLVDAATFAASALAFAWLARTVPQSSRLRAPEAGKTAKPTTVRARTVLRARPLITGAFVLSGVGEFFQTVLTIGIPVWLTDRLHAGPGAYALVLSAMGIGSLAGNILTGNTRLAAPFPSGFCAAWAVRGLLLAAFAGSSSLLQVVVLTALGSLLVPVTSIALNAEIAALEGPEQLRMFSVCSVKLHLASMGSMLLLPAVLERTPRASFAVAGTATAVTALLTWTVLKGLGHRQALQPGQQKELARN